MKRLAAVAAVCFVLAQPWLYAGMFAGDAAVYLAYAERAARGHWFQFNPGEVSAGVTSPGYLALLTLIYRAADPSAVPVLVKALNFAAWYGLAFVVWRLGRVLLGNPQTAAVVGLVAAAIPGSCYNATVGMENGVFALALVLGVWAATGRDLRPAPAAREALEGLLWGAAIWLRPEGIVAAGLWFSCRAIALRSAAATARRGDSWRLAAGALIAGVSWGALLAFHYAATGALIPASARARTWLATLERVHVGPLSLDPKFGLRLLAYLPIGAGAVAGTWCVWRQQSNLASSQIWRFLTLLVWLFVGLYSSWLGGYHLARYAIFVMPGLCLLAGLAWQRWLAHRSNQRIALATVGAAWLIAVFTVEASQRLHLGSHSAVQELAAAPSQRRAVTDAWLTRFGRTPVEHVTVALVEVQLRYFVDGRITVRSLDGRTDPLLFTFVHPTFVDHAGYLKARRVNYLLDLPNYNRDASAWSLAALRSLAPGDVAEHDGLTFRRVRGGGVIEVIPDVNTVSADSPPARRLLCCRRVVLGAAQGGNGRVPPPARSSGPGARE